jgi:hypothetical protein
VARFDPADKPNEIWPEERRVELSRAKIIIDFFMAEILFSYYETL